MGGGSDLTLAAPFLKDPLDPLVSSEIVVFAKRVVTLGSGRCSRVMLFDFCWTALYESLTFETSSDHGRPKIISKVGVSREATQKKSKKNVARKPLRRSRSMFFGLFSDSLVRNTYF